MRSTRRTATSRRKRGGGAAPGTRRLTTTGPPVIAIAGGPDLTVGPSAEGVEEVERCARRGKGGGSGVTLAQ